MLITYLAGTDHVNFDNVCKFSLQIADKRNWNLEASMTNGDVEVLVRKKPYEYVENAFLAMLSAKKAGRERFEIGEANKIAK